MSRPQISILMAVRNEQAHLPAALASLQSQSLRDWELVAVDDGSRDRTLQLLRIAAQADPRIRVVPRPPQGLVNALNTGLRHCRAPLIARMDGDDICHPRRLELQSLFLRRQTDIGLVATRVRHFPRWRLRDGMRAYEQWQNEALDHESIMRDLYVESPFAHPSVMMRRSVLLQAGGYRDMGWAEDYDLWLRLARQGVRFARLPQILLYWRDRPQRLTRTAQNCSAEAFRLCKLHHLQTSFLKDEPEVTLWGAGMEGKMWRRILAQAGVKVTRWVEVDRRKIGQKIHDAPVVPIDALKAGENPVLVTVGARGARSQIRTWSREKDLQEGRDLIFVT
ncbi:MAG TPA: glycosyltransferase [Geoalkalibacter subterraneus]|uniref:Glycosyltransferase n=1 Tax=Geoalkalibacter subterraneus TaxID=483547 RepID=A0A831PIB4_9BACT|nr:glycosyltransferase [Geoalkalibacter subterraneus]